MRQSIEDGATLCFEAVGIGVNAGRQSLDPLTQSRFASGKHFGESALTGGGAARRPGHVHDPRMLRQVKIPCKDELNPFVAGPIRFPLSR